jgi:hypothetical protein
MAKQHFVILEHSYQGVHFDLMLEVNGKLRTWRLAMPPHPGQQQPAEASFDHRLSYLEYEGPISGDRGTVRRWDHGTYEGEATDPTMVGVMLRGARLSGRLLLRQVEGQAWQVAFGPEQRKQGAPSTGPAHPD